jgi:hypothetical protein
MSDLVRRPFEASSELIQRAVAVVSLVLDEPWFTYHTDHEDGIERTALQLALCELARVTPLFSHDDDDGCLENMAHEDALDELAAAESAASSPIEECRSRGHYFRRPHDFRDRCERCGCERILRGNPSRFVYEYPDADADARPADGR